MTETDQLESRYRKLLRFDRFLWLVYSLTALIPGYFLFTSSHGHVFHAFGVLTVVVIARFGWVVDTRLLDGRLRKESPAYWVTAAFILSRVGITIVALYLIRSQHIGIYGSPLPLSTYWSSLLHLFVTPPMAYLLFFAAFYRFLYHISVHFLLKIQELKTAPYRRTVEIESHK